jgi:hypothetical protein
MRRPRLLRLAPAVAAALLASAAAPAAAAPGDPIALSGPADSARLTAGAAVALRARTVPGDSGLELRVSRSPAVVDACGRIDADVAFAPATADAGDPSLYDFATGRWFDQPGTYYWQVDRVGADGSCSATEVRHATLRSALPVAPALAGLSRERIPRRIGESNGATFRMRTSGVPAGVSPARFLALVRNSARRWRLHSLGRRPGAPRFGNGRSEVGFSTSQVPPEALAVTIVGRRRGGGLERDLIIRADIDWDEGPAHPTRRQYDLETVMLHEMGHFAGNAFHVPRGCLDTPMVVGLARGEWWRSTTDFSYRACNTGG